MRIYLVRHGESECNVLNMLYGRTDCALTDRGREQAALVGEKLRGCAPFRCVSSPLLRAAETARIAAGIAGCGVEYDPRLMEQDMGEWENVPFFGLLDSGDERLRAMLRDWTETPPPGGESYAELRARVEAALHDITERGEDTLIVAHNGPLATALALLLGLGDAQVKGFWFEQGCWSCVEELRGEMRLKYFNK